MRFADLHLAVRPARRCPVPAAQASMAQESIFEDGTVLLQKGPARQAAALDEMAALGADTIRALVVWRDVARSPDARRLPAAPFVDGRLRPLRRPRARRGGARAEGAADAGRPDPALGVGLPARRRRRQRGCKPSPALYGDFVAALGRRYSGTYADENQGGAVLPRVDRWSFWNEPNQAGWLSPQYVRRGGPRAERRRRPLPGAGRAPASRRCAAPATAATCCCSARPRPSAARPGR